MSDPAPAPLGPPPPAPALDFLAAGLAGFACVAAELALVRLLGPWFGQSNLVWANAVGVVLAALALGSLVGGRLADRAPTASALVLTLVPAALWFAAAARLAPALGAWLAPSDLGGDRPLPLSFHGSLAATVILLGPPVLATGVVGPLCVRRLADRLGPARAAGWVSATSTVGGLLACVLVPTLLVPAVGSRRAICGAALLLGAAAVAFAFRRDDVAAPRRSPGGRAAGFAVPRGRAGLLLAVAFLVGLALTSLEFAAVRALAPRYGQASATYATVIGVVIAALAVGNATGGMLARVGGRPPLMSLVAVGAVASATVPLDPHGLLVDAAVRFGSPALLLGLVGPFLVRALAAPGAVGRASGAVFGVATVGSLVGCYVAPLWALPERGTRWTIYAAYVVGVAAGLVATWRGRRRTDAAAPREAVPPAAAPPPLGLRARSAVAALAVAGVLVPAALLALPERPLRADPGQVEERESAYQTVRVVEETTAVPAVLASPLDSLWAAPLEQRAKFLRFDEDLGSYQSLVFPAGFGGTGGRYYDHLALGAWFQGMPWNRPGGGEGPRVLIVGYAGGTLHRVLRDTAPAGRPPRVVGVEIDPDVVALARKHLRLGELEDERLELHVGEDGRSAVERMPEDAKFDLVFVDAYQRTQYVPFHLATFEFFRTCTRRLTATGAIGINVNAPSGLSGRLIRSLARTLSEATGGGVWIVPNPQYPGNATLWGTMGVRPPRLPPDVPAALEMPAYALDRLLVRHVPETDGGELWTDDRAPVERWTDEALRADPPR